MEQGYVKCAVCGKMYDAGTLSAHHTGYGRRTIVPQRRWYSAREVKTVSFARHELLCPQCGGEKIEPKYRVQVHRNAVAAWKEVEPGSELAKYMPKYLR